MLRGLIIIIFSVLLSVLLVNFNLITFGVAIILVILPLVIMRPNIYFLFFLLARPVMDVFSKFQVVQGMNLAAISTIFLVALCVVMLAKKENITKIKNDKFLRTFNRISFLFLGYCFFLLIFSPQKAVSLVDLLRLLSIYLALNYAAVYFSQSQSKMRLFWFILASAVVPLFFGAYQLIFQKGLSELGYNRINATFVHPNGFAQYLVLIFFILFYLVNTFRMRMREKIVIYPMFLLVVVELLFTYTRGAWIALGASVVFFVMFNTSLHQKVKYIFLGVLVIVLTLPFIQTRFSDTQEKKQYHMTTWQWRLQQWEETGASLMEHPFIGNGMGTHEKDFKIMAHNDYLRVAYETGVFGLIFYLGSLLCVFIFAFRRMFAGGTSLQRQKNKLALVIIASLMIMSFADNLARSTVVVFYYFVAVGWLLAAGDSKLT